MDTKERMAIPRHPAQDLPVEERITHFHEVTAGYDHATALMEAERCLQCKKTKCRDGCPIHNNIPKFIGLLRENRVEEAYWAVRETSSLPAICSRVCPHEFQCEGACIRGKKGQPVAIGMLERYIVDWMVGHGRDISVACAMPRPEKVAIIGSGPAGMTVAYHLAHAGFQCTIFETLPVLGGMLTVGIPPYRLPRSIIAAEFEALRGCGVRIIHNTTIGRDKSLEDLRKEGFSAVFVSVGAHASRKLGIDGEELAGVSHGVDYLRDVNLGRPVDLGKNVVVVGGGNVAIDVARTALRRGSDNVFILYRRTRKEMPAAQAEIHHLEEEGVRVEFLAAPVKIHGENGRLTKIECIRMELGECDASGRCRPVPVAGSNFFIAADSIVAAISQDVDAGATKELPDIAMSRWNTYEVDPLTLQTTVEWIFAGGDAVLGPQTVAKAVFQGKVAAESISRFIDGRDLKEGRVSAEEEKSS